MSDEEPPPPSKPNTVLGTRAQRGASIAKLSASTGAGYLASRVRGLRDADAEERFHAATAEKILELLGEMKGAAMKLGQIASFVDLDLPPEVQETYQGVLADLRAAAPAVDPATIAAVVEDEYGAPVDEVFAAWEPTPLASASIGQVHRATLHSGEAVVAKVQYPGVAEAIEADLANAETFAPLAKVLSPHLQVRPLMEEMRARLTDELDYQREAQYQQAFFERYDGHPFIRVPRVFADYTRPRVLVSEYVEGQRFEEAVERADAATKRRYGEIVYRFVYGSLYRFRLFNGDPHPGNYLFPGDGTVVFLDFGSVKLFSSASRRLLQEQVEAIISGDADRLHATLIEAGFIPDGVKSDPARWLEFFRLAHAPLLDDAEFTYTSDFARDVIRLQGDPRSGFFDLLRKVNLPPEYLLLNRISFGVNSILASLGARANWRRITQELWYGGDPATDLGREEAAFVSASAFLA